MAKLKGVPIQDAFNHIVDCLLEAKMTPRTMGCIQKLLKVFPERYEAGSVAAEE